MYRAAAFVVDDPGSVLVDLLSTEPATVVVDAPDGLDASILPLLFDPARGPHGTLIGHVARGNPVVSAGGCRALVLVTGPQGYISPSWLPSKAEHGRAVPTWNYVAVQATGVLAVHDDRERLRDVVTRLTDGHEGGRDAPWAVTDAPATYIDAALGGIVGIEIPIDHLEAKAKLSQNRSDADLAGLVAGLRAEGASAQPLVAATEAIRRPGVDGGQSSS